MEVSSSICDVYIYHFYSFSVFRTCDAWAMSLHSQSNDFFNEMFNGKNLHCDQGHIFFFCVKYGEIGKKDPMKWETYHFLLVLFEQIIKIKCRRAYTEECERKKKWNRKEEERLTALSEPDDRKKGLNIHFVCLLLRARDFRPKNKLVFIVYLSFLFSFVYYLMPSSRYLHLSFLWKMHLNFINSNRKKIISFP